MHIRPKRTVPRALAGAAALAALALSGGALANHSVLVEGESDFDGDGLLGEEENNDGDQVFGTINAAVGSMDTAPPANISDNGQITIVTSGRFAEQVTLTGAGVEILQAAPGVEAVVEAFVAGDSAEDNNRRQQQPGIIVHSDGSFPVIVRNITSRNWTTGILVRGSARVTLDDVQLDSNVNYGVRVQGDSKVVVTDSQVNASGYRRSGSLGLTPGGDIPPAPGVGIEFEDGSSGIVSFTTVAHSFSTGIMSNGNVRLLANTVFDNHPNYDGFW